VALPGNVVTITVTGTYTNALGVPSKGVVMFRPGSALSDQAGMTILAGTAIPCPLNNSGAFTVVLPCTDNTTLSPTPFWYDVTTAVAGVSQDPFSILLPSTLGATVDMAALAPAPVLPQPSPGLYVISVNGQTGAVTTGIGTISVSGTPVNGQVLTATSLTTAAWEAPGSNAGFVQGFTSQSSVTVNHDLGRYPAVTVTDTANDVCFGAVTYLSLNAVLLTFSAPFSGTAVCT
jgi:hypothetical protein